jgi:8-oxo-dGTP pyrophosphatase MutT (NUDIX family)
MSPPAKWRTIRSRILVDDVWLRLRADTCETAEGVEVSPYYVVDSPDFVVMAALTTDNHLVLVRQYRHAYGALTLELPAGRREPDEDPLATATRELEEETGYAGGGAQLIRVFSPNPVRFSNRLHAVLLRGVSASGTLRDDPTERIETVLWPLSRLRELYLHPEFIDSTSAGVLAAAEQMLAQTD